MSTLNQWGNDPNIDEGLGDVAYDTLESKAKEEAKDLAKDGIQKAGDKASKALDAATDHIAPVKQVKDKIKEKLSNNPITRFKAAAKKAKEKVKQGIKKLAKEGLQAVGKLAAKGIKALGHLIAAHPVIALIVVIVVVVIISLMDSSDDSNSDNNVQTNDTILDSPMYVDVDGMMDDDVVVVLMDDCVSQQYDVMGELNAEKEAQAKFIYSVFRSYGFNNASLAGILGNMDKESGLDSSAIEGIFSEYGFLGSRKAEALLSLTNYTENTLFPNYNNNGLSYSKSGYETVNDDGRTVYYCGIGLVQWTGPAAYQLLKTAETMNMDWYNMDFQLAYLMCDSLYRPGFFSGWVADQYEGTDEESWIEAARDSGIKYAHDFEGNTAHDEERADAAEEWYNIIKDWDDNNVDQTYVDSITDMATELGGIINFIDVANAQYRCLNGNVFDNSSLANAAISFAWPTKEQAKNNGTNLYQVIHDGIWPTDFTYKACDRAMAMAVLWSGTDDDYPIGCQNQRNHLMSSDRWELVGLASDLSMSDLQPGDIFLVTSTIGNHTFMYTGTELIQAAYAGEAASTSDSVAASLNDYSAACSNASSYIIESCGGVDPATSRRGSRGTYEVWRCVDPQGSTTYTNLGSGVTNN